MLQVAAGVFVAELAWYVVGAIGRGVLVLVAKRSRRVRQVIAEHDSARAELRDAIRRARA